MAIGTPVSLGTSAGVATTALTTTAAVAAGDSIVVHAWVANTRTFTSVTDSVGNTYTQDQTVGTNPHMAVWSCHNAIALPSGSTITANLSSSTISARGIDAMKVSGLATSSVLDVHTSASGSTAAWSVGPTGTLAQADELAVYAVADNAAATANTPDGSWADVNDFATSGTADARLVMGYRIVSATTALTASGTMGAEAWTAIIATYKGAAAASSDTATSGIASALSVAPSARTQAGVTANPAGGVSPAVRAQSSVGAVTAAGVEPSARVQVDAGTAAVASVDLSARAQTDVGAASTMGGSPTVAVAASTGVVGAAGIDPSPVTVFAALADAAVVGVDASSATAESPSPGAATGVGVAPVASVAAQTTLGVAMAQGISPTDGSVETDTTLGVAAAAGYEPIPVITAAAAPGVAATSSIDASAAASTPAAMGFVVASGIGPTVPVALSFELVTLKLSTPPRPVVRVLVTASPSLTVSTRPARTLEVA